MRDAKTIRTPELTDILFQRCPDGLCLVAPDGTVVRANAEWLRSTGFTEDEVLGESVIELFPETRDMALAIHARARGGHRVEVPRHAQVVNGRETWWEGSIEPVPMDGGTGLLITARDVSGPAARRQPGSSDPRAAIDTAGRKKRERAAVLEEVFRSAPSFFHILRGPQFVFEFANEAYYRLVGRRDLVGRPAFEALPEAAHLGFEGRLAAVMSTREPFIGRELPVMLARTPGGPPEERLVDLYYAPLVNPDGSCDRVLGLGTDVTEQVRERRRSGALLAADRDALERMHALSGKLLEAGGFQHLLQDVMDAAVAILAADKGTLQLLEGEKLRIVVHCGHQKPFLDFFAEAGDVASACGEATRRGERVLVSDVETSPIFAATASLPVLRAAGVRSVQSTPLRTRAGRLLGILTTQWGQPHTPDDHDLWRLDLLVRQAADLIEQKRAEEALRNSEQQLRVATLAAEIGVWSWIPGTSEVVVSSNWRQLFGIAPDARVTFETWAGALDPADRVRAVRELNAAVEEHREFDTEYRVVRPDGTIRWIVDRGRASYDEVGRATIMGGVNVDVTGRKHAEEALRRANELLREADRRKDDFLGMVSHELRNLLAPIRNSTYILQHADPGGEQARRAQAVIERQTDHLTRLVDDLLDVTRIARGKIELRRSRIDLCDVVGRAADDFRWMMRDRGVQFDVLLPDELLWTDADATRITQVVGNLLHNASKFTRRGDEVSLSLEAHASTATIRVRDTGAGIELALLPRVFEAFVQGERTLARTDGGLGLGLTLVKGIVELHGGSVRAESAGKGKGAEFAVCLPLLAAPVVESRSTRPAERRSGGRRVLVVDDNRDAAESLADVVTMLGHTAEVAFDGPSAIEKARANPPNLVLCDLGLPEMSGYEVARTLRARALEGVQLIAVSGYAQPEDVKRAIDAGFDGHVAKPFDAEQIERLLG